MNLVVVRGAGDLATGIIYKLHRAGFSVLALEVEKPRAVRRTVSFCEAVYEGEIIVEGVKARLAKNIYEIKNILASREIPIYIDPSGKIINELKPKVVVDSIIAKKNLGTNKEMADITIAIGPGFIAGKDVDIVIESQRGHYLGRIIEDGEAIANTGIPGEISGVTKDRVLRATKDGIIKNNFEIGDMVEKGDIIANIDGENIFAEISGILRGMIKNHSDVKVGLKIGDIDPRGDSDYINTISEKARNIAGGVLEAILYLENKDRGELYE